jgi:hypothetical protein
MRLLLIAIALLTLPAITIAAPKEKAKTLVVARVDFDRDVRPILSENCFACHGFDANKRQAGLRLDTPEGARQKMQSGKAPLVPGKPDESELLRRLTMTGPLQMPPRSSGKHITPKQIVTIRAWIQQGGQYAAHWSFAAVKRPTVPTPLSSPLAKGGLRGVSKIANPIDAFILARLEKEGLKPSPEADRHTLIRRVTLDLTGLLPTWKEVEAFVNDKSPNAYEKVVDRLLASPHYGERMALKWLDLARYADTHGYHIDSQRDMWRWRDWVIEAFNKNLPYDQFIVQQIAGDLLPNATIDQKIATGFNRNHPINFEGGAIPEEYQVAYVADRVDTTSTAMLGLTLRCSQCHDHKFDPLSQKDYYRFYAFFNTIAENGLDGQNGNAAPSIKAPLPGQMEQLEQFAKEVARTEQAVTARVAESAPALATWERDALKTLATSPALSRGLLAHYGLDEGNGDQTRAAEVALPTGSVRGKADWTPGKFGSALKFDGKTHVELGNITPFDRNDHFSYGAWVNPAGEQYMTVLSHIDETKFIRGWDMFLGDRKVYVHLINRWEDNAIRVNTKQQIPANQWTHVFATYDGSSKAGGVKLYINGKPAELDVTHDKLTETIAVDTSVNIGRRTPGGPFYGMIDEVRIYRRDLNAGEVALLAGSDAIRQILTVAPDKRTPEQKETITKFYLDTYDETYRKLVAERDEARKKHTEFDKAIPTTMVMQEMEKPRETHILVRGQYDKFGEKVTAAAPAVFPSIPKDTPNNRLGLAKWLVDPSNPLVGRVAVNRFWEMLFGVGLVKTAEDFGVQGERPSHPELLDWLAVTFVGGEARKEKGESASKTLTPDTRHPTPITAWDTKAFMKMLVLSATYRQTSRVTPELLRKDPENRLLARGPRQRLPAEFVRDLALVASGLLVEKIGGPSVKPYHPAGLWEEMAFGGGFTAQNYVQDHGENLYRRSMYTFWKRTVPPPSLQTFDAPEREFCIVRRSTTNTPLQALILMNDPTYVEASRKFAERMMTEASSPSSRLVFAYRTALSRDPNSRETAVLLQAFNQQLDRFRKDRAAAEKLIAVGESPRNPKLDVPELAAWSAVANIILNLDETISKG